MNCVKLFFCDVETTGVDPLRHGVTQVAGEIGYLRPEGEYDSKTAFNFPVAPFPGDAIEQSALDVQKKTRAEIEASPAPAEVFRKLKRIAEGHVDKYEPTDKLFFVAYNSPFDNAFMREFWRKNGDRYFGSLFWTPDLCVMRLAAERLRFDRDRFANFKLATVAEALGVMGAFDGASLHDASTDIRLTRDIYLKLTKTTP